MIDGGIVRIINAQIAQHRLGVKRAWPWVTLLIKAAKAIEGVHQLRFYVVRIMHDERFHFFRKCAVRGIAFCVLRCGIGADIALFVVGRFR